MWNTTIILINKITALIVKLNPSLKFYSSAVVMFLLQEPSGLNFNLNEQL